MIRTVRTWATSAAMVAAVFGNAGFASAAPVLSSTVLVKSTAPTEITDVRYCCGGGAFVGGLALGFVGAAALGAYDYPSYYPSSSYYPYPSYASYYPAYTFGPYGYSPDSYYSYRPYSAYPRYWHSPRYRAYGYHARTRYFARGYYGHRHYR